MVGVFSGFINSVIDAEFDFAAIGEAVTAMFDSIKANVDLMNMWNAVLSAISSFAFIMPIIFIVFGLIELVFGKKLMPVQRFLACILVGYCAGVLYISPLINNIFTIPSYVSGLVIAIVAAVLSKYVYFAALAVAAGYSVYMICFRAELVPFLKGITDGNYIMSLVFALVAIVLVFILRKYVEMLGTSLLGVLIISRAVIVNYYDYRELGFLGDFGWLVELIIIGVLGLVGFIIQIKTRTRY